MVYYTLFHLCLKIIILKIKKTLLLTMYFYIFTAKYIFQYLQHCLHFIL